jgi:hypothetical protein
MVDSMSRNMWRFIATKSNMFELQPVTVDSTATHAICYPVPNISNPSHILQASPVQANG